MDKLTAGMDITINKINELVAALQKEYDMLVKIPENLMDSYNVDTFNNTKRSIGGIIDAVNMLKYETDELKMGVKFEKEAEKAKKLLDVVNELKLTASLNAKATFFEVEGSGERKKYLDGDKRGEFTNEIPDGIYRDLLDIANQFKLLSKTYTDKNNVVHTRSEEERIPDDLKQLRNVSPQLFVVLKNLTFLADSLSAYKGLHSRLGTEDLSLISQSYGDKTAFTDYEKQLREQIESYQKRLGEEFKGITENNYRDKLSTGKQAEFEILQQDLLDKKAKLDEIVSYDFKGYIEMYNLAYNGISSYMAHKDAIEYAMDPWSKKDNNYAANIQELMPSIKIKDTDEVLKPFKTSEQLTSNLDSKYTKAKELAQFDTSEIEKSILSEERLNDLVNKRLVAQRDILETMSKIVNIQSNKQADVKTNDPSILQSYMDNISNEFKNAGNIRESLVRLQNALNSESMQTDFTSFHNIFNEVTRIQSTLNNGLLVNFDMSNESDENVKKIKALQEILSLIKTEAGNIKVNVDAEALAKNSQLNQFSNYVIDRNSAIQEYNIDSSLYKSNVKSLKQWQYELEECRKMAGLFGNAQSEMYDTKKANLFSEATIRAQQNIQTIQESINKLESKFNRNKLGIPAVDGFEPINRLIKLSELKDNDKLVFGSNIDNIWKREQQKIINRQVQEEKEQEKLRRQAKEQRVNELINSQKYEAIANKRQLSDEQYLTRLRYGKLELDSAKDADLIYKLKEKIYEVEQRITAEKEKQARLNYQKQYAKDINYVKQWELENNKAMSAQDRMNHYQGLLDSGRYAEGTNEYQNIYNLRLQAQNQYNNQLEQEERDAVIKSQQAFQQVVSYVKTAVGAIVSSFNKLVNIIRWSVNNISQTIKNIGIAFNSVVSTIQRVLQLFGNFGNRLGLANNHGNILKNTFTELKSKIDLVTGAFNKLINNKFIKEGKSLLSSIQSLNILIGTELTQSTIEWANELERGFGLSAAGIVSDLKELTGVMKGLGMTAEHTSVASQNLLMLGNTLSSVIGYDTSTVISKINSGMKGMTASIDDLGLSVREAQMNSFLKELKAQGGEFANIGTSFSSLTEQQRVYVRYAAIMSQFMANDSYNAENYEKSLNSITGRLTVLSNRIRTLTSTIGRFALNIFDKIIGPLTYVIDFLTIKITTLAESLGLYLDLSSSANGNEGFTNNLEKVEEGLDNVSEAAKEAKGSLDGWDHVTNLSSNSGTSGDDFDYSKLMELASNYAKELEEQAKKISELHGEYLERSKKAFEDWMEARKNAIKEWYKELTGRDLDLGSSWKALVASIKVVEKEIVKLVDNLKDIFGALGMMVLDDLNIGTLIERAIDVIANALGLLNIVLEKLKPHIIDFYKNYISPLVKSLGSTLYNKLQSIFEKIVDLKDYWRQLSDTDIKTKWIDKLITNFNKLVTTVKRIIVLIRTLFTGETTSADLDILKNADGSVNTWTTINSILTSIHTIIVNVYDIVKQLINDLVNWLKSDGLDDIKEFIDGVAEFISKHKDSIINIIEKIADVQYTHFQTLLDIFTGIGTWVVEHEELVIGFLESIKKILQWIGDNPVTAVIGFTVANMAIGVGKLALSTMGTILGGMLLGTINGIVKNAVGYLGASGVTATATGAVSKGLSSIGSKLGLAGLTINIPAALAVGITTIAMKDNYDAQTLFNDALAGSTVQIWADKYFSVLMHEAETTGQSMQSLVNSYIGAFEEYIKSLGLSEEGIQDTINQFTKLINQNIENGAISSYGNMFHKSEINAYASEIISKVEKNNKQVKASTDDINNSYEKTTKTISTLDDIIGEHSNTYSNASNNISTSNETISKSMDGVVNSTNYTVNSLDLLLGTSNNTTSSISNKFKSMSTNITKETKDIVTVLDELITTLNRLLSIVISVTNYKLNSKGAELAAGIANGLSANSSMNINNIKGFANGGVPKSGSIFYANENGNLELAGNFGGYSGVANQGMIIDAMQGAISNSMESAINRAMRGNNTIAGNTTIEVCKGGIFVGDNASIRKLANMINNVNTSNIGNIANTGFNMI